MVLPTHPTPGKVREENQQREHKSEMRSYKTKSPTKPKAATILVVLFLCIAGATCLSISVSAHLFIPLLDQSIQVLPSADGRQMYGGVAPSPPTNATAALHRTIPKMAKSGGFIFFLHVPKTGGTTIRDFFASPIMARRVQYLVGNWKINFECAIPTIEAYLSPNATNLHNATQSRSTTKHRRILFVEVHGMDNYNALELDPHLARWRGMAAVSGTPFFSFTLLREPISVQVSFFNYYFAPNRDCRFLPQQQDLLNQSAITATKRPIHIQHKSLIHQQEQLIGQVAYCNPQCLFLARGERTFGDRPSCPELDAPTICDLQGGTHHGLWNRVKASDTTGKTLPHDATGDNSDPQQSHQKQYPWMTSQMEALRTDLTTMECNTVWDSLRRSMDWIGTTERLSTETMPLLNTIVYGNAQRANFIPVGKMTRQKSLKVQDLSTQTLAVLKSKSALDLELYERILENYKIDYWIAG